MESTKTKVCSKCKEEKPTSEFHKHSNSKDGCQPYCKSCQNEAAKNRGNQPLIQIKPEALAGVNKRPQFKADNPLSAFTPRELMQELRRRGYDGELTYTCRINLSTM